MSTGAEQGEESLQLYKIVLPLLKEENTDKPMNRELNIVRFSQKLKGTLKESPRSGLSL